MNSIWVTHCIDRFDISSAKRFLNDGHDFKTIFSEKVNSSVPQKLVYRIDEVLNLMDKNDALLIMGNPVVNSLCCAKFFKKFNCLNLIVWDAVGQCYVKRNIKGD